MVFHGFHMAPKMAGTKPSEIPLALPRRGIEEPGDAIRAGREHLPGDIGELNGSSPGKNKVIS